jgi:murein hydrolase activator
MKQLFFTILFLFTTAIVIAQTNTKEELQRKKQDLNREIEEIKTNLAQTGNDKKETMRYRLLLSRKIEARNQIIESIKEEVYYIEKDIIRNYREIDTLKKELDSLKAQYAKSVIYAYKNRSNYDFLNFLFSAGNFNDALKRISYLKNYRQYREQQAGQIQKTNEIVKEKVASLTGKRQNKNNSLAEESKEVAILDEDKKEQDRIFNSLQSKEKEFLASMKRTENKKREIDRAIKKIIEAEIAKARELEKKRKKAEQDRLKKYNDSLKLAAKKAEVVNPTPGTTTPIAKPPVAPAVKVKKAPNELENTPEGVITSAEFLKNKGNLPWPVEKSFVTFHFGTNRIPAKPRDIIQIKDGLTMETAVGASIKCIFEGEVVMVDDGADVIVIKHGSYFSAYGNIGSASVSVGQKVGVGQVIGKVGTNDDGSGEMELLITNEKGTYFNPESWLRRR